MIRQSRYFYATTWLIFTGPVTYTNLTMIIDNIGATNPHIAPSSVSIQQLKYAYIYSDRICLQYTTNNSSCPYWS